MCLFISSYSSLHYRYALYFACLQLSVPVPVNALVISSVFKVFVNQPVSQMTAVQPSNSAKTVSVCRKCGVEQIMIAVTQKNA
jgi:hypothetical protein